MSWPYPLSDGDKIRVVAPSGAFSRDRFDAGIEILHTAGFSTSYDEQIFSRRRYLAGGDDHRLSGLLEALHDPDAKAIWAARGGYGATRIVDHTLASEKTQWLVGFSDITALHAAWSRAGVKSVHGANITTLMDWGLDAREELFRLLRGELTQQRFEGELLLAGSAVGPLRGGNLTVLAAMVGTAAMPAFDDAIVLLEDVGEAPYRLDRALTQLVRAARLERAAGFVVGQLTNCGDEAYDVLFDVLEPLGRPVLAGVSIGHESSARAVCLEADASIEGASLVVSTGRVS